MAPINCAVCKENASKYKCPQCLIKYCSVPCFKTHKASCAPPASSANGSASPRVAAPSSEPDVICTSDLPYDSGDDESKDEVTAGQLRALEQSSALRDMLYNPHLRDIVTGIDGARDPTAALKKAMAFPIFTEMADECLRVVAEHGKADELMYKPPPPNPLEALDLTV